MFWDKGYTPSQNIENLLQKENVTLEEFLDDEDILQECKSQKKNLILYLTRPDIIKRLIELTITEPPEDVSVTQRFKHANMACEILTFGLPSLDEKLVEDEEILKTLYSYLEKEPPLNPLLSSFFNKTFSMLVSKKAEKDWFLYQKMCLQVLEFIKSQGNFLDLMFRHFATPVIMDLLLQIIREVQGVLKKDLYEWLTEQNLVERLISILGKPEESEKHKNISEFLCDLIRYGRSLRQKDQQENDSFEQVFLDGNPLLLSIENHSAISQLVNVMLLPDAEETTVVAGVKILLTLADESIVDEPASDLALQLMMDKEKENNDRIISIIVEVVEPKISDLHNLLLKPPQKNYLSDIRSELPPPFGLTRLQICILFTVLIRIGDKRLIDAICETFLFNTLLKLFKEYCWNNFLHSEVEKCLRIVFSNNRNKINNNEIKNVNQVNLLNLQRDQQQSENKDNENSNGDTKEKPEFNPSALQKNAIVKCKVISKLVECWMLNKDIQSSTKGCRLGFMGHLIKIFDTITTSISESEELGALIVSNLSDEELKNWLIITNNDEGELSKDLKTQKRMLANCNAYESALPKEFHNVMFSPAFLNDSSSNLSAFADDDDGYSAYIQAIGDFEGMDHEESKLEHPSLIAAIDELFKTMQKHVIFDDFATNNAIEESTNPWESDTVKSNYDNANDGDANGWNKTNNEFFADFDSHFNDFDLATKCSVSNNKNTAHVEQNQTNLNSIIGVPNLEQSNGGNSDNNANFEKMCNEKMSSFEDDDNFDLITTRANAEKIIESIVNDDNSDLEIGDGDGNGKMQTDEDDIFVNKISEINSFNKVQEEVLDNPNNFTVSNNASNGPVEKEISEKLPVSEKIETITNISNYRNDHIESGKTSISSTTKDISYNSNENSSNSKTTKLEGGCEDTASFADKSS